ncbi:glycosyltransferase family 4 protein [Halobacterium bonnevillei]|uniref:Glycosyltransferase n=1 Tax=Halobacterium bonnevillei TaxID=2692200 RepID=A0A6B0SBJ9_9EURY|nr:glycosyltransferase family 4 protein [Halobacterium bonnevillei]MXR19084.1 glycosyltransferase [Halobacterium bonnevillei]
MGSNIGVFVGSASSFNIIRAAENIGQALSEEFSVHLVSTKKSFAEEVSHSYEQYHGTTENSSTLGEISALRSYIESWKPDALFQITEPPIHGTIVGCFAAVYDIPFVYRYSGDRFYEYRDSLGFDKIVHFGLNNVLGRTPLVLAEACVALGPTGNSRLVRRGVPEENIRIIPPIVNKGQFSPDGSCIRFDTDRHVGLFVGRLSRRKGKEIIERNLPKILDRRSDLQFVFIGEQTDHFTVPPHCGDNITFVGSVPPEEVPKYYRASSFMIHPSLSEGVPRAVLEANAAGVPTIARDVGDVGYVTDNTFTTESEFVNLVCDFESLQPNSVDRFTADRVKPDYARLFHKII